MGSNSTDARTLLVDDSEIIQKTYGSLLNSLSFNNLDVVVNGEDAIEKYKSSLKEGNPYKLVILDYHLPGMNGAEVLSHFRKEETDSDNRAYVIIATTNTHQHVPLDMLDRGADDYLIKPIMKESFVTAIDCFLET